MRMRSGELEARAGRPGALSASRRAAVLALTAAASALALVLAVPAQGASGGWERAWGKDVIQGAPNIFQICTVAANCKRGEIDTALGGELSFPFGVATDSSGNVYVADAVNARIQKFDSDGNFERAWGKGAAGGAGFEVCIAAVNCKAGAAGDLGGELDFPLSVAVDPAGEFVYVADASNNRIQRYTSAGAWDRTWGWGVVTGAAAFQVCTAAPNCQKGRSDGNAGGALNFPSGLAVDGDFVYVADSSNHRIQRFLHFGAFQGAWGKGVLGGPGFEVCTAAQAATCVRGENDGQGRAGELNVPWGVAVDGAGKVYVGDEANHRIQRFDSSGSFELAWGRNVVNDGQDGFQVCAPGFTCKRGVSGQVGGELSDPRGVDTDGEGYVYVADTSNNRIQRFESNGNWERAWGRGVINDGAEVFQICTVAPSCKGGSAGTLGGELNGASGVAAGSALFVADVFNHRIQRFGDAAPPGPDPDPPGAVTPSNAFSFAGLRLNRRRGIARLGVRVPGAGRVIVFGPGVRRAVGRSGSARVLRMPIRARGRALRKLNRRGRVRLRVRVTYRPAGGTPRTRSRGVRLAKRR